MYADSISAAMKATIDECERRRKIQIAFNKEHGITATTIIKAIREGGIEDLAEEKAEDMVMEFAGQSAEEYAFSTMLNELEQGMESAARNLQFEKAAKIRDKINEFKNLKGNKSPVTRSPRHQ